MAPCNVSIPPNKAAERASSSDKTRIGQAGRRSTDFFQTDISSPITSWELPVAFLKALWSNKLAIKSYLGTKED